MTDIVTAPSDGDATVRAMVADVINSAWTLAGTKLSDYETKISAATGSYLDLANAPTVSATSVSVPTISAPAVTIPATQEASDVSTEWGTQYAILVENLSGYFTAFITSYFPSNSTTYATTETLLQSMLSSNSYLPAAFQTALLGDDQARIIADKVRAQDAAVEQFAARGFPLPPGAAASLVLQIEQKAQAELAASSRKILAAAIDQFRFVFSAAMTSRKDCMTAATEYVKALASAPDIASRVVGVGYDAQSKLISAAAQFYEADIKAADTVSKVSQYNASQSLEAATRNQASILEITKDKLLALQSECDNLKTILTSLYNNVHAQVSINAGRNASVQYQYSNDTASTVSAVTDVG